MAYIPNSNGKNVELGIFTNDSYKEISAVVFSTTGTFGKVVAQAGTASFMRVTRLRKITLQHGNISQPKISMKNQI